MPLVPIESIQGLVLEIGLDAIRAGLDKNLGSPNPLNPPEILSTLMVGRPSATEHGQLPHPISQGISIADIKNIRRGAFGNLQPTLNAGQEFPPGLQFLHEKAATSRLAKGSGKFRVGSAYRTTGCSDRRPG